MENFSERDKENEKLNEEIEKELLEFLELGEEEVKESLKLTRKQKIILTLFFTIIILIVLGRLLPWVTFLS